MVAWVRLPSVMGQGIVEQAQTAVKSRQLSDDSGNVLSVHSIDCNCHHRLQLTARPAREMRHLRIGDPRFAFA
jgi:hypothetical protein